MRKDHYEQLYKLVKEYGQPVDTKDKASKAMDFARPIPGHYDIRGMRLLDIKGSKALLVLKHNGEAVNVKDIRDEHFERELIVAAQTRAAMREDIFNLKNPGIENLKKDSLVESVQPACPGFYSVKYDDGSMSVVNSTGHVLDSPMHGYDVIQEFRYLGNLQGMPHFAFKGQDYATRSQEPKVGMFDLNGHEKWFRDPRVHPKTMEGIQQEFDKLVKASLDMNNPRRNDPMLADWGIRASVKMHF